MHVLKTSAIQLSVKKILFCVFLRVTLSNKPDWVRFPSAQIKLLVSVCTGLSEEEKKMSVFGTWLQKAKSALPDFYANSHTCFFDSVLTPLLPGHRWKLIQETLSPSNKPHPLLPLQEHSIHVPGLKLTKGTYKYGEGEYEEGACLVR